MKKFIVFLMIIVLSAFISFKYIYIIRNRTSVYNNEVISYISKAENKSFYIYRYGKWEKYFVKGVNIGAAKPGTFPGELAITKAEYLRWLKEIADMNADAIRVYTILTPNFYDALYEHNKTSLRPIYIFQGVWINEENMSKLQNAHNPIIKDAFKEDIKTVIDIIHGNAYLPQKYGYASGTYVNDVSAYVLGWILGIEWDPIFVQNTNKANQNTIYFNGKYLYAENSSPFEAFLTECGDYAIDYETEKYKMQRPLSFTNWVTTDTLKHPNEPLKNEDLAEVNTEHIKGTNSFKPGLFASYHVYPYYPDSMNYQHDYAEFRDDNGEINTYKAYLRDLIKEHTVPVLIAEFGIPASRGMAHKNIYMGYNQGNIDERSQGNMNAGMIKDIYDEGYVGGLIFAWQDEWFKRTWNTMELDLPNRRPYWSNPQANEQEFGILAFDPGKNKSICYVDGDISDWKNDKPLVSTANMKLYIKSDEKYLYIMSHIEKYYFERDKLLIPIDITPNSGNLIYNDYHLNFNRPTDMVIVLDKISGSRIVTDSYYDVFYFIYAKQLKILDENLVNEKRNSGIFNPIYLCLNKPLYLPQDKITLPLESYETGKLLIGDGNPNHKNFNSLTDYAVKKNNVEIRIPWQLLNVMDPSAKMIIDNFHDRNEIVPLKIPGIYVGEVLMSNNEIIENSDMEFYDWEDWEAPSYNERLKPSYDILKKAFKSLRY